MPENEEKTGQKPVKQPEYESNREPKPESQLHAESGLHANSESNPKPDSELLRTREIERSIIK